MTNSTDARRVGPPDVVSATVSAPQGAQATQDWTTLLDISGRLTGLRVVVTGGSGFIGTHLVGALLEAGATVTNLDVRAPNSATHNQYWTRCDTTDESAVREALGHARPALVYNLAAIATMTGGTEEMQVNTTGLANVLRCGRELAEPPFVVHFSTQLVAEAGFWPSGPLDFKPYTAYGQTKAESERIVHSFGSDLDWVIVRPTNVWGPLHPTFADAIWRYLERGWYLHPSGREPKRSYGYVTNVVCQVVRIAELPRERSAGRTLYVGDDALPSSTWLDAFSNALRGADTRRVPAPLLGMIAEIGELSGRLGGPAPVDRGRLYRMTTDYVVPMQETFDLLGRGPVALDEGVARTVEWLRARSGNRGAPGIHGVVMVGPFPPPLGGASKITAAIRSGLEAMGAPVTTVDTSGPALSHRRSARYHFARLRRNVCGAARAARSAGRARTAYLVPDGGTGLWYTVLHALATRRFEHVFVHHHTYRYVDEDTPAMRAVIRLLGPRATHVFLTREMARRFEERYGAVPHSVLGNAAFTEPHPATAMASSSVRVRLGHLGNLCREKGFFSVAGAFERLRAGGADVELHLAGPVVDKEIEVRLAALRRAHGGRVIHHGPLHGDAKSAFYRSLDVFLFPTEFDQEAAPNVLFEAAAAGVPSLTVDKACIPELVDLLGGSFCAPEDDYSRFVCAALGEIPEHLSGESRERTRQRFEAAHDVASGEADTVLSAILATLTVASGGRGARC